MRYYQAILFFIIIPAIVMSALHGCAVNPATGRRDFVLMSENQEIELGKKYHAEILKQYKIYNNPELQTYVSGIGEELAKVSHRNNLIFRFTVLDSPQVNAFALPGGYIYITRGILAYLNSEAELAGVLGHEIGHVTARHSVRQHSAGTMSSIFSTIIAFKTGSRSYSDLSQILGGSLLAGYGRSHELEADRLGAEYLARTGYAPDNMIDVIGVLKNQEVFAKARAKAEGREINTYHGVFATHPANDKRLREVIAAAKNYQTAAQRPDNRDTYLQMLNSVIYDQSPTQGIIRQGLFLHPDLGIAFKLPQGWRTQNLPDRVLMINQPRDAVIQLTVIDLNKRESPKEFLSQALGNPTPISSRALQINGLDAYSMITESNTSFGKRLTRYVTIFNGNRAYLFAGTVKDNAMMQTLDDTFLKTASGFHRITAAEKELAKPYRITLHTVKRGENYASLAAKTAFPDYREQRLRLINGQYPAGEPKPGATIKLVQ